MTPAAELLAFAGIMVLGQFSPGPDMVLLTRTALKSGARAGVEMAMGIGCGLMVHSTLAVGGLALAFDRLPALREVLRWLAAAYLLWLAVRIARESFVCWYSGVKFQIVGGRSESRPFVRGLFCNLLNPKAAIFLAAVSAPFLRGDRPLGWPLAIWLIVVVQGFLLWSLWALVLQWQPLRRRYERAAPWIDAAFAVVLAGLAVRLVAG